MLNRRHLLGFGLAAPLLLACGDRNWTDVHSDEVSGVTTSSKRIAITMDDFALKYTRRLSVQDRNAAILSALAAHNHKAAGFITGDYVDSAIGKSVVKSWHDAGHLIANHSFSHQRANDISAVEFTQDIARNQTYLEALVPTAKNFRFPFLYEGENASKRNAIYDWLSDNNYRHGAVTIGSHDWYISERLEDRLNTDPNMDVSRHRDYYVGHIVQMSEYFHRLALRLGYPDLPHTLLIHHNILNGLFLRDVLDGLAANGWEFVDAETALAHPIFDAPTQALNYGQSILRVLAVDRGVNDDDYPAEAREFGAQAMDELGL